MARRTTLKKSERRLTKPEIGGSRVPKKRFTPRRARLLALRTPKLDRSLTLGLKNGFEAPVWIPLQTPPDALVRSSPTGSKTPCAALINDTPSPMQWCTRRATTVPRVGAPGEEGVMRPGKGNNYELAGGFYTRKSNGNTIERLEIRRDPVKRPCHPSSLAISTPDPPGQPEASHLRSSLYSR